MNLPAIQAFMSDRRIDAWLVYDFRGNNPVLAQLLPGKRWTTRRALLLIPQCGRPTLLTHTIDAHNFAAAAAEADVETFLSWRDLHHWIAARVGCFGRVAMEYAPGCTLPVVSIADAGIVELVRSTGVDVISSADLMQTAVACWSPAAREAHGVASCKVAAVKDAAFALIGDAVAAGRTLHEHDVQRAMQEMFRREGLESPDGPIVAVNAHAGNPHFEPSEKEPTPIRRGDWVLIDLWARLPGDENVFSDITWVGYVGRDVPSRFREVYEIVRAARDASLARAQSAWKSGEPVQGWQLDDAAREVIIRAGHEKAIRHRTGHSLSPGPLVHGLGMNLDNLETHDTRRMLPGIGFTIEPGIYLADFGVRMEINVFVDPKQGPVVTSCSQTELVLV